MNDQTKQGPWTFAKATIQGRAGMDAKLAYTPSGKAILSVSVAVNKGPKENRRTIWLTAKAFGELAQSTTIRKGDLVTVDGNLDISSWQDRTTMQQRDRVEILADAIQVHVNTKGQPVVPSQVGQLETAQTPEWVEADLEF